MSKKTVLNTLLIGIFSFGISSIALAEDYGLGAAATEVGLSKTPMTAVIASVIAGVLSFLGIIFFGIMVYAGIRWMVSRGNEEQSKKALHTIFDAVIGIIVVLSAYAITNFVFTNLK